MKLIGTKKKDGLTKNHMWKSKRIARRLSHKELKREDLKIWNVENDWFCDIISKVYLIVTITSIYDVIYWIIDKVSNVIYLQIFFNHLDIF